MNRLPKSVNRYLNNTHTLLYSYLISLPLFVLYEVLIHISQPESGYIVRVTVDIWIRTLFSYLSHNVLSITLIVLALIGLAIFYYERNKLSSLKLQNFVFMLAEAIFYAFLLALFLGVMISLLFQINAPHSINALSTLQKIALSLGAGLYEELFFRVLLVSGLLYLFKLFTKQNTAFLLSVVIAALMFSAVHYFGPFSDTFTASSFVFRFFFGIALNILYLWRGFGVAAWTHAFYDIMVVVFTL